MKIGAKDPSAPPGARAEGDEDGGEDDLLFLQVMYHALVAIFGTNVGTRFGFHEMWQVWLLTLALIPVLYFPCKAFAAFKRRSTAAWVRYL